MSHTVSYTVPASSLPTTIPLPNGSSYVIRMLYSPRETSGVIVLVVISCFSLIAVVALLAAIALSAYNTRKSVDPHLFVRTPVAGYFISLLIFDIIQAIGSIINAAWINRQMVEFGSLCVAQGFLKQSADVGAGLWTVIIAGHTFCILFLEMTIPVFAYWATLVFGWSAIITIVILGPATLDMSKRGSFWGISGYWCWISAPYQTQRITLDYMFMFLSAFFSFVLYTLVFLRLRGNIILNGWRWHFRRRESNDAGWARSHEDKVLSIARTMLLFPIAYTILILPIAVARFTAWTGHDVPFEATIFGGAVFLCSGLVNVALFTMTRKILPPQSVFPNLKCFGRGGTTQKAIVHVYPKAPFYSSSTASSEKLQPSDTATIRSEGGSRSQV